MQQLNARALLVVDYMQKNDGLAPREAVGCTTDLPASSGQELLDDPTIKGKRYAAAQVTH